MQNKPTAPPHKDVGDKSLRYSGTKSSSGAVGMGKVKAQVPKGFGVSGNTGRGGPVPHNRSGKY